MKTTIENHTQILEKLNKLTFVKKEGNSLISDNGFTLRWDFEFRTLPTMPIQLLIRVLYEDAVILTWGCSSNEDTEDFAKFIQVTEVGLFATKYNLRDAKEQIGKAHFNNL
jgi:hypothetical protein